MTKAPAFQFYPNDWLRDMMMHPSRIRGAWTTFMSLSWWEGNRGRMTKSADQWARAFGESVEDTLEIINYIKNENIGEVLGEVTNHNSQITLISRRMIRDDKDRKNNCERQRRFKDKHENNRPDNEKVTPPSSSSTSSSTSISLKEKINTNKKIKECRRYTTGKNQ